MLVTFGQLLVKHRKRERERPEDRAFRIFRSLFILYILYISLLYI
jgi:hypothetical protein